MKSLLKMAFISAILLTAGFAGTLSAKVLSYEIRQDGVAAVSKVVSGSSADLVLFDSGKNDDFCTGAICLIERKGILVAEAVISESTADKSVALITQLETNQMILAGDSVKLKTITF